MNSICPWALGDPLLREYHPVAAGISRYGMGRALS